MKKPETLGTVHTHTHTPYIYKSTRNYLLNKIRTNEKSNLGNKVVLVSVSEKGLKNEKEVKSKNQIELNNKVNKDSLLHYKASVNKTCFVV